MNIPDFPLPSDPLTIIKFRSPTVADCMSFSELEPSLEEQITTQYLNCLQVGDLNDSASWTGEDRRTALWWIFIATNEDKTLTFSYHCDICDDIHYPVINLTDWGENAVVIKGKAFRKVEFNHEDKVLTAKVHPLNGYSLEHLESLKNERNQYNENSIEYKKANNELSFYELLHSFDIDEQQEDQNQALENKKKLIQSMTVDSEFRPFVAKVEIALRDMRHGLLTKYNNAEYFVLGKRSPCDKEEQDRKYNILLPFRNYSFIPIL